MDRLEIAARLYLMRLQRTPDADGPALALHCCAQADIFLAAERETRPKCEHSNVALATLADPHLVATGPAIYSTFRYCRDCGAPVSP